MEVLHSYTFFFFFFIAFQQLLRKILKHTHSKLNNECSRHWIFREVEMQATIPLAAYFGKNMR